MNELEQTTTVGTASGVDKLKLWAGLLLLAAGIAAYYVLNRSPSWQRWLAMVAGLVLGALVFATSNYGRRLWRFVADSRVELRKVVWPNRQDTLKMTGVIFFFMVFTGVCFWVLDLFLAWATRHLTGQGG